MKLKNGDVEHLESELGLLRSEKTQVQTEMSAVNQVRIITFMADNNDCEMCNYLVTLIDFPIQLIYAAHRSSAVRL